MIFYNCLLCFAIFYYFLQFVTTFCNVLLLFAMFYYFLQCFTTFCNFLLLLTIFNYFLQCFTMFYYFWQLDKKIDKNWDSFNGTGFIYLSQVCNIIPSTTSFPSASITKSFVPCKNTEASTKPIHFNFLPVFSFFFVARQNKIKKWNQQ